MAVALTPDLATLTEWVTHLYHPRTPEPKRKLANEKLTAFQQNPICWSTSIEILSELQGDFARIQNALPIQLDAQGVQIAPAEVAELLVYFAANSLSAQAKSTAPFMAAIERGESLGDIRNRIAQLLFLYRNSSSVIISQLGVAAATSVVFECCTACDPSYSCGVVIDDAMLDGRARRQSPYLSKQMESIKQLEGLLRGERMSTITADAWPSSNAYLSCHPGPQIEEIMSIFNDSPAALVVLFREIAEELANSVERTSQENLMRALGWLLPHTRNVFQFICGCAGVSVPVATCLETMASWIRLHNAIQDGPPQDLTWGRRAADQDRRKRRLMAQDKGDSSSAILQVELSNYLLIQNLSEYMQNPSTMKEACYLLVECAQLWGIVNDHNRTTWECLMNGLAAVSSEIIGATTTINAYCNNDTLGVMCNMLGQDVDKYGPVLGLSHDRKPGLVNLENTDNAMYPRWTKDQLEDGADEENDLVLIWLSAVSESFRSQISSSFARGDLFILHASFLQVMEAIRKLLFHINFTIRVRSLEVLTDLINRYYSLNYYIWDGGECHVNLQEEAEVNGGVCNSPGDKAMSDARFACGEFAEALFCCGDKYLGIDPSTFFQVVARSIILGSVLPTTLGGSFDFCEGEKVHEFLEHTIECWNGSFLYLIDVPRWILATDALLLHVDERNWSFRQVVQHVHGKALHFWLSQRGEPISGLSATQRCLQMTTPVLDDDHFVSSCLLRAEASRLLFFSTRTLLPGVDAGQEKLIFMQGLGMLMTNVQEMTRAQSGLVQSNSNIVGGMPSFQKLVIMMSLRAVVESLRLFMYEACRLFHANQAMTVQLIEEVIHSYGNIILSEEIPVAWRLWICNTFGDMIMTQDVPTMMGCHENIVLVILQGLKNMVNKINTQYNYSPDVHDPSKVLPPAFVNKMSEVVSSSAGLAENVDAAGQLAKDFYGLLTIFWNAIQSVRVTETNLWEFWKTSQKDIPTDMSLWPPTAENRPYIHPNMVILEKFFDEVAPISLLVFSNNSSIVDSCCNSVLACIDLARSTALKYPVASRFVELVGRSHVRSPSIYHFNALRTLLGFADVDISGSNQSAISTVRSLALAIEMSVSDVIDKVITNPNYLASNPQMVGMAVDTFGLAVMKPGVLSLSVVSNLLEPTGLKKAIDVCIAHIETVQDVKVLMTMILALTRLAYWWTPSHKVVSSRETDPRTREVLAQTVEQARRFALSAPVHYAKQTMVTSIRLIFTNFESNDQWLGLVADCISETCSAKSPFREAALAGLDEGLCSLSGEYLVGLEQRREFLEKISEGLRRSSSQMTAIIKECVTEHHSTIRMRTFAR